MIAHVGWIEKTALDYRSDQFLLNETYVNLHFPLVYSLFSFDTFVLFNLEIWIPDQIHELKLQIN